MTPRFLDSQCHLQNILQSAGVPGHVGVLLPAGELHFEVGMRLLRPAQSRGVLGWSTAGDVDIDRDIKLIQV